MGRTRIKKQELTKENVYGFTLSKELREKIEYI